MINFIYVLCLVAQSCPILCIPVECSLPGSPVHGGSPGKNTGVGCHALCQGIFPTQGSNPSLLHCRRILHPWRHQGSPNLFIVGQREREKVCVCVCVCVCARALSHVQLFATPWTVACQAPLTKGFSGQVYWSGLPYPMPGDIFSGISCIGRWILCQ